MPLFAVLSQSQKGSNNILDDDSVSSKSHATHKSDSSKRLSSNNPSKLDKRKSTHSLVTIIEKSNDDRTRQQEIIDSVEKIEDVCDIMKLLPFLTKKSNAPPPPQQHSFDSPV